MKKLWIAVPAYDGTVTCETAESLNAEVYEALARGWPYVVQFYQQDPIISYARNFLVMRFLASDFTDMIFIDSDIGFPMGTLCKLAEYDVDVVACSYPYRTEPINYPVRYLDKPELWANEQGLIEVAGLPTGCFAIKRHVLERLIELHPELMYRDRTGEKAYSLFDFKVRDGVFYGEDYTFCNYVRDAGFKIFMDPMVEMTHTGTKVYRGNIGKWLKARTAPPSDPMENIIAFAKQVERISNGEGKDRQIQLQQAFIEARKLA